MISVALSSALAFSVPSLFPGPQAGPGTRLVEVAREFAERGDLPGAAAAFEKAVTADPASLPALRGLSGVYAALEDPRAEEIFRRALARAPQNLPLRFEFAEFLWQAGRWEEGNAEMERLLVREPTNARLRGRYAEALMEQRRFVQAADELERACRSGDCDAGRLDSWAQALLETGRFEEASRVWRRGIDADSSRASLRHGLGRLLLLKGNPKEAREELARAAVLEPGSAAIRLDLGRAQEALERPSEAEAEYREALRLEPQLTRARYALGTLLSRLGRTEEARREIAVYQAAFEREQQRRQELTARRARIALGWTKLRAKNPEAALDAFEGLPEDAETLRARAAALSDLGRHGEAARALEAAVRLAPEDARLIWALGRERERERASR